MNSIKLNIPELDAEGVRLGWLIDPKNQMVEIYRQRKEVEILDSAETLSGEDVLVGFVLNLKKIW